MHAHPTSALIKHLRSTTAAAALVAMAMPAPSQAQTAPQAAAEEDAGVQEEIVVTGSRIVRDGFEAPTPVSVLSSDDLNVIATPNIADAVNRLPALQDSLGPQNAGTNVSSGTGGVQHLNLRALSAVRTLVLLDGKRVVGSTLAGFENNGSAVDVNGFPGGLISRVDVVTGGASAVYGSDALAGVVNFVLDKEFTGLKGEVQGGITTYGDNPGFKVSLTGGTPFAGGRGHLLGFGEHTYDHGIKGNPRPWRHTALGNTSVVLNPRWTPTNGEPRYEVWNNTGLSNGTPGGIITSGPLKGTMFLEGGTPAAFRYGEVSGNMMRGGDVEISRIDSFPTLLLRVERTNFFTRASYDLSDNITAFAELSWAHTHAQNFSLVPNFRLGNLTIRPDNAFIPETIRTQVTALGLTQLQMGSAMGDGPFIGADNGRTMRRYVGGFEGKFNAFDTDWSWDAYYSRSTTHNSTRGPENMIVPRMLAAIDAVVEPGSGRIVCRINADTNAANDDPTCLPYNIFGTGVNSQAQIDSIKGTGYMITILTQDAMELSTTGEPFSTWAGPVSLALGVEHRKEKVEGLASALDEARAFFAGNYIATNASYDVTEGFLETVVPLAKEESWAQSLDLNAAARFTGYSESGFVTTWKVGATYNPIDEVTLRATRSRDIRAPNLGDLFNRGRAGTGNINDPVTGLSTTVVNAITGNADLQPEKADTTGFGVVYSPSWLDGFTASVDYYNINIKGAIVTLGPQQYVDRCFADPGSPLCAFIERNGPGGQISFIATKPANVLQQKTDGIDFEASYALPLSTISDGLDGDLSVRMMANYVFNLTTIDNDPVIGYFEIEGAGVNADGAGTGVDNALFTPHYRHNLTARYDLEPFSVALTWRRIGSGKYNNELIECTSGCPATSGIVSTISENDIPKIDYFDTALTFGLNDGMIETFFVVQNLFNKDPPRIGGPIDNAFYIGMGNSDYDRIGRTFRVGARFRI